MTRRRPLPPSCWGLAGESAAAAALRAFVRGASSSDRPLLLAGEPGAGHEQVARAAHLDGRRAKGPFEVRVAASLRPGELKAAAARASGGTLFLDGVERAPAEVQAQLAGMLARRSWQAGRGPRVIAGTSRHLREEAAEGRWSRTAAAALGPPACALPPLRERREDIPVVLAGALRALGWREVRTPDLAGEVRDALRAHDWPLNLRDVEHLAARWVFQGVGPVVALADLPLDVIAGAALGGGATAGRGAWRAARDGAERAVLAEALRRHGGNQARTARSLGIHRNTLINNMRSLGLTGLDRGGKAS